MGTFLVVCIALFISGLFVVTMLYSKNTTNTASFSRSTDNIKSLARSYMVIALNAKYEGFDELSSTAKYKQYSTLDPEQKIIFNLICIGVLGLDDTKSTEYLQKYKNEYKVLKEMIWGI